MASKRSGRRGYVLSGGAVLGLALAAGCDSGSTSSLDSGATGAGTGGEMAASGSGSNNSGAGAATGGTPSAGAGNAASGSSGTGAGGASGGSAGASGGSAGASGGSAGGGNATSGASGSDLGGDTGASGAGGDSGAGGSGGDSDGCLDVRPSFVRRASNVMFVVDRSGTMFPPSGATVWAQVRDAVLPVIDARDATQNIGFLAMTGELNSCPLLDQVAPANNNYPAIAAKYGSLAKPTKGESPFMMALAKAGELLGAAPAGDKYVIFVIDGEPDYCNDGNLYCAVDSTVARLQALRSAGITTLLAVLPFPSTGTDLSGMRQTFANAGAGLPTASFGATPTNLYFQCNGNDANWTTEFTASGKPAQQALGSYSDTPGGALFTALDPSDGASLTAAFSKLFARTASCNFDLSGGLKVALDRASSGEVSLDGASIAFDSSNGWRMQSETVLELTGTACDKLRESATAELSVVLPCSALKD